jgi:hypothetical protein
MSPKRNLFRSLSFVGLGLTLLPSFLVFGGVLDLASHKWWMLAGTVLWFATAPLWMRKKRSAAEPAE